MYVRRGLGWDEPLVSAVRTEADAIALDVVVRARHPQLEVRWEAVPWHGHAEEVGPARTDPEPGQTIHLVLTGAENNEGGIAVFADREAAEAVVHAARVRGADHHMQSVRLGEWLSEDHPFD